MSAYDPLNQEDKNFNLFFEGYFAKGMPCIFTNGGLNDPAPVSNLDDINLLGWNESFRVLWFRISVDSGILDFSLCPSSQFNYCNLLILNLFVVNDT